MTDIYVYLPPLNTLLVGEAAVKGLVQDVVIDFVRRNAHDLPQYQLPYVM